MRNKRALSNVVSIAILISLTIGAIATIFYWILPLVQEEANLSPAVSCIYLKSNPVVTISNSCINESSKEIILNLNRKKLAEEIEISSISFIITSNSSTSSYKCDSSCKNCRILEAGKVKSYFFNLPDLSSDASVTFFINDCEISTVKVSKKC